MTKSTLESIRTISLDDVLARAQAEEWQELELLRPQIDKKPAAMNHGR